MKQRGFLKKKKKKMMAVCLLEGSEAGWQIGLQAGGQSNAELGSRAGRDVCLLWVLEK